MWDCLQGIVEEFGSPNESIFNEGVFNQTSNPSVPVINATSPHGYDEAPRSNAPSIYGFSGIPLEESDESIVVSKLHPLLIHDDSSSSVGSSESDEPQTPLLKSQFKAFIPPPVIHPSAVRPTMTRNDSSNYNPSPYGALLGRTVAKKLAFDAPSRDDSPALDDMDYPDPYGIAAALESASGANGYRGGITSRSTPHSTRPGTPRMDRVALAGRASALQSPAGSGRGSIVAATKDRFQPAALARHVQESFPPDQWDTYRASRCGMLLDWWRSYVDDGEVQLATAVLIVGGKVVNFPRKQSERVLEAYIGELFGPQTLADYPDLLERYQLSIPVAYVRKYANVLSAQTLATQDGITHILHCARCGKSTGSLDDTADRKTFWWCTKCRRAAKLCAVW